jgi:hypothetical protein
VLEADPRWQLVHRIVSSSSFAKSHKLRGFLLYVCEQTLLGNSSELNEQTIGVEVLGKPAGYDSNEDNIVRAHASRLRQKLDAYFGNQGAQEPLRITIPKGAYVPSFQTAAAVLQIPAPDDAQWTAVETAAGLDERENPALADREPTRRIPHYYWVITVVACTISAAAAWLVADWANPARRNLTPQANHAIWEKLLGNGQQTSVVSGDSSLVLYENITGQNLSVSDYVSGQYRVDTAPQSIIDPKELGLIARRRLTSIVDLNVAERIAQRPEAAQGHVILRYARDLHVDDLKQSNYILVGALEANPWVQLFDGNLNFNLIPDQETKIFTLVNRSPKPGEQPKYFMQPNDPNHRAYATVALLPNLGGNGRVLIIQGTAMAGTEAAADFVLEDPKLEDLLHLSPSAGAPLPSFEILLETANLGGNAPSSKVIAYRVNGR